MQADYDVAIVGGGMVGASLACALAGSPLRTVLIEAVPFRSDAQPSYDERGLSLSLATQRILESLAVWPALAPAATPIEHIHVSDRGRFGFVRLHAADMGIPALGHVAPARELGRALLQGVEAAANVELLCPAAVAAARPGLDRVRLEFHDDIPDLGCRLLVVADGSRSALRESLGMAAAVKDYGQTAVVAAVSPELPHRNWAFERFTDTGPLALLPLRENRCVLVYTVPTGEEHGLLAAGDEEFLGRAQSRFGRRLGRFIKVGARRSYPLVRITARRQAGERVLLLGNAAHTVHPNGAQGFNLGLRDAAALAEHLTGEGVTDPGARTLLQDYCDARRADQNRVLRFTDGLTRLFYNNRPARIAVRDAGMLLLDILPGLKQGFMRRAMGIGGRQPRLVMGAPLPGGSRGD
ncbi:MAG: 2-octaprenyl-6-methoxyphenyl hydroxylase [Gammaproteobacteria bacterium]|jgi:2-octaprenyl-6-methoxyphenol hydroxylase